MRGHFFIAAFSCIAAAGLSSAFAQAPKTDTINQLTNLTDEPSRADLFKLIIKASEREQPPPQPGAVPFNLYGPFTFPSDAVFDVVENKPRTKSIFGIDISHYTSSRIPIEKLALMKMKYVYAKATQGTGFKDGKFHDFWSRMDKLKGPARLHRGAYHFLSASGDAVDQAKTFVGFLKANGGLKPTDMPPVLDLEWDIAKRNGPDRWTGQNPDAIIQKTLDWLRYVESATHRKPMLYTARAWWRERIKSEQKFSRLSHYKIWIADYSRSARAVEVPHVPNRADAALWQFSDAARLAGSFPGTVDVNIYKDTENNFYNEFDVAHFQ